MPISYLQSRSHTTSSIHRYEHADKPPKEIIISSADIDSDPIVSDEEDFPFTHEEILNTILANTCPSHVNYETGQQTFKMTMHCAEVTIIATSKSNDDFAYTIHSFKTVRT